MERAAAGRLTARQLSVVPGLLERMNIARHIALIDELCFRPFMAERTSSHGDESGPGYHVVVLESSHGDIGTRAVTVEQY